MINESFTVFSTMDCKTALNMEPPDDDYFMRETQMGCHVLYLLQEMYKFDITYIDSELDVDQGKHSAKKFDELIDIYARPRTSFSVALYNAYPIMPIYSWRFGYTLRRTDVGIFKFYSQPFTTPVWDALLVMLLLAASTFYVLSRAEQRLLGSYIEGGITHELLIAIGGYCQHYLPVSPIELTSRRIAIFSFFLFSYVIYAYYASTLLSELVNDKDKEMSLEMLADSTYENIVLDKIAIIIEALVAHVNSSSEIMTLRLQSFIELKFTDIRIVNMTTGLEEMMAGKSALLSDYTSLYSTMKKTYDSEELCDLIEVDLFSNVYKYVITSKKFKYIEEFKIGILRAKETGVLQRLLGNNAVAPFVCHVSHFQAHFGHIQVPLLVLACSYLFCVLILIGEKIHFQRYRLWPYVE